MNNFDYLPAGEAQFKLWYDNFVSKCDEYGTDLGLTTAQITAITNLKDQYSAKLAQVVTTKEVYEGAVSGKNLARKNSTTNIRAFAKQFKAIQGISPEILKELGIVSSTSTGPVRTVTSLDVVGCDDGVNKLTWDRNQNAFGTTFVIEYRIGSTGNWVFAGTTTKVTFNHGDQIPGQTVYYRVTSSRAGVSSAPSPAVGVYIPQGETELSIAA
jgi:hypothetical protein